VFYIIEDCYFELQAEDHLTFSNVPHSFKVILLYFGNNLSMK